MASYKHIVVALDFAPTAESVGLRAKHLAERCQAKLTLLHVVEYSPPITLASDPFVPPVVDVNDEELREKAVAQLARLADKLGLVAAQQQVLSGIPKYEIVQYAQAHRADLILIGSHGRHGIRRLLGSTADSVLHNAECDVLAVRIKD